MNDPAIYRHDVATAGAVATLQDWSAMAGGRGVTVGDLRAVVNPSLGRTHAFDGLARTTTQGMRGAGSEAQCCGQNFLRFCDRASRRKPVVCHPWQTPLVACDEPCFSRRGDHPPSLRSRGNGRRDAHEASVIVVIWNSKISQAAHP
jgi:hypothetical protein